MSDALKNNVVKGIFWASIEGWGNKLLSFFIYAAMARLLEPKIFGLVATAYIVIDYFDMVASQGLGMAIIQRKEIEQGHINAAFWMNIILTIIVCVIIVSFAPFIARFMNEPELSSILSWLTIALIISSLSRTQAALLTRDMKFKALSIRGLGMSVIGGAVGIYFAYAGFGVWALILQQLAAALTSLVLLWTVSDWRPTFCVSRNDVTGLYRFSINVLLSQQVSFLSKKIDEMLIATFLGPTLLGYYSISKRMLNVLSGLLLSTTSRVFLPTLSLIQSDRSRLINAVLKATMMASVLVFPVFVGGAMLSSQIISIVFGPQWMGAEQPMILLMLTGPFLLAPSILHTAFMAVGLSSIPLYMNCVRAILSGIFIFIGSSFGLVGIAGAVLVKDCIGSILDVFVFKKYFSVNMCRYFGQFFVSIPSVVIMFFLVKLFDYIVCPYELSGYLKLPYEIFFGAFIYFFSFFVMNRTLFNELRLIVCSIKRKFV